MGSLVIKVYQELLELQDRGDLMAQLGLLDHKDLKEILGHKERQEIKDFQVIQEIKDHLDQQDQLDLLELQVVPVFKDLQVQMANQV